MAVGLGARGGFHADVAGGAAAVIDHDLAAELRGERLGDEARHDVHAAAGRERRDQPDRLAGVGLARREGEASAASGTNFGISSPS